MVIAGMAVDFVGPHYKLVLEIDGYRHHRAPADRTTDRRKERILKAAGYTVTRALDTEIRDQPRAVAGDVAAALCACAASGVTIPPVRVKPS
jgi:very-short-patch-repair endonuclease